jgi:alpha-1,3-rhamnosyl/mannosyltransferase
VLVGKPRLGEAAVRSALEALPDDSRVVRLNGVSRRELAALYQGADLFVFPSLYEGFGLPVLEAMLARTPVVTTRRASIPEIGGEDVVYSATPDEAGLAAAMETVLTWPPARRAARVEAAHRRARTFEWNRTAAVTLECLRQAAG